MGEQKRHLHGVFVGHLGEGVAEAQTASDELTPEVRCLAKSSATLSGRRLRS
jgi:hypothetical protein